MWARGEALVAGCVGQPGAFGRTDQTVHLIIKGLLNKLAKGQNIADTVTYHCFEFFGAKHPMATVTVEELLKRLASLNINAPCHVHTPVETVEAMVRLTCACVSHGGLACRMPRLRSWAKWVCTGHT